MNQEYIKFKEDLASSGLFRHIHTNQYVSSDCPYCGDIKGHMYIKISLNDDSPVLYYCHKCLSHGIINEKFLNYFQLNQLKIPNTKFKKKIEQTHINSVPTIDMNNPNIDGITKYIESRLNVTPTLEELEQFQYLSNPIAYVDKYLTLKTKPMYDNRFWFKLTNGNITGRYINNDTNIRWAKLSSTNISDTGLYNIKSPFDLYQDITVYISEGIFDSIGLYYYTKNTNSIYLSSLGKSYQTCIMYLIKRGIFGNSVHIKICKDNDVPTNTIFVDKHIRKLFKSIEVCHNAIGHDYGDGPIQLEKCLDWRRKQ